MTTRMTDSVTIDHAGEQKRIGIHDSAAVVRLLTRKDAGGLKKLLTYQFCAYCIPGTVNFLTSVAKSLVKRHVDKRVASIKNRIDGGQNSAEKHTQESKTASIILSREYGENQEKGGNGRKHQNNNDDAYLQDINLLFDSILHHVAELPNTKHLHRTSSGMYIMATDEPIEFLPYVFVRRRKEGTGSVNNTYTRLEIEIYTYTYDLTSLRKQLHELEEKYKMMVANNLGKHIYFFDEMVIPMTQRRGIVRQTHVTFKHYPLRTNKNLDNIYGDPIKIIRKRVDFFMHNKKWYEDKGVPYTLGLLLHGVPGSGKTSAIKGIARVMNRHVFNMRLTPYTTVNQLNHLFYSPRVNVLTNGQTVAFDIPIEQRIMVLEDIDCLDGITTDRNRHEIQRNDDNIVDIEETLTLSHLLNILDGVLEQPGRILIMTTNHPEKLDAALVRPGRIDAIVKFDRCKSHEIVELVEGLADFKVPDARAKHLLDGVFTPAEVARTVFEHMDDKEGMLLTLCNGDVTTLTK